jgi:hypothetical protein
MKRKGPLHFLEKKLELFSVNASRCKEYCVFSRLTCGDFSKKNKILRLELVKSPQLSVKKNETSGF